MPHFILSLPQVVVQVLLVAATERGLPGPPFGILSPVISTSSNRARAFPTTSPAFPPSIGALINGTNYEVINSEV